MNKPLRIIIIDRYNFHIVIDQNTLQNEYFPFVYKSVLIENGLICFEFSDTSATSSYNPLNFLS